VGGVVRSELALDPNATARPRVLLRRVTTLLCASNRKTRDAIIDTGCPLSFFPWSVWHQWFNWRENIDYERLRVPGADPLRLRLLDSVRDVHLCRITSPLEIWCPRAKRTWLLNPLIAAFAESANPEDTFHTIILGYWGGFLESKRLRFDPKHQSDDLDPFLEW
jgi:hypothetical protein